MSERARELVLFEDAEEEAEPEAATESAGGVRPPGRIASGLWEDSGEPKDWRSAPIEDLNLSMRVYNRLRKSGLNSVGHILERTEDEIFAEFAATPATRF